MLTVNGGLRIHVAHSLADATKTDPLARQVWLMLRLRSGSHIQFAGVPGASLTLAVLFA
jgi:hypothetical protein